MAIDLIVEVMDHAPADLTPAERYALVVLAEDARLPSREVKHGITDEYFLARLRLSEASWANTRSSLVRKKALEKVGGGYRGAPARYRIPIFNPAMKGHRSGDPLAPESFTEPVNQPGGKVHRSGEKRFTDPVIDTYITPSTPSTTPEKQEAEGATGDDKTREASALVGSLPANLRPGRGGRPELVAAVAELLALGWPAEVLRRELTSHTLPERVHNLARLMVNWLPAAEPYVAKPARDSPPSSNGCDNCHAGKIELPNGVPDWCPTCYPERTRTT